MIPKPGHVFDREREWLDLCRFAEDPADRATMAVVSGRRRQGKSMLVTALSHSTDGFYFAATEAAEVESLRQLRDALSATQSGYVPALPNWDDTIRYLFSLAAHRPLVVVLDEFPFLAAASPSLPSILQRELGPDRRDQSRIRLVLCGSAVGFMGRLLGAEAPLRGRSRMQMIVRPFDLRVAKDFWGLDDPRLAVLVHSVVGGTPAYLTEVAGQDAPRSLEDFDDWVCRTVLHPTSPLFFEARYLLAQEGGVRDAALYHSILGAVAGGQSTRGAIARSVGRPSGDLSHYLLVLEDVGLLRMERDALRPTRTLYRIEEPLITFYYGVVRPVWSALELAAHGASRTRAVWDRSRERYESGVLGPHFERMCRDWASQFADPAVFVGAGGEVPPAVTVASAVVNDPARRTTHEVDVMVVAPQGGHRARVLSIGEAKWGTVMNRGHVDRLLRIRALLQARDDVDVSGAIPACYSAAGFSDELRQMAARGEVLLVGLDDLYGR